MQGATVTAALLPGLREIEARWHAAGQGGYRIEVAGAVEESSKGVCVDCGGIPIMLFITFTLLMLQLHSFSRAMLVFLTGPLGLAGVAGALLAAEPSVWLCGVAGVIALMGMIQRNSVILIDQIEQDRARRACVGCDCGVGCAPPAPHRADCRGGGAGHDSLVAQRFWGPYGRGHHGWLGGCHRAHFAGFARDVRSVVQGASPGS